MSFPRYERYRDSGIEWLGNIPSHWQAMRFPYAIHFQEGPGIMASDFQDDGVPLLRVSGVQRRWATLDGCNFLNPNKVAERWDQFRLNEGDLLISASASMGTVCEVGPDTVGAIPYTGLIRLTPDPNRITKDFIRALVVSDLFAKQIDVLKAGATIQHFGPTHLGRVRIALPPLDEQHAIAEFLDRETAKIDDLIAEQQRLIELLKEKRQAVISHAVTKGLNPDVPMKDSGIEWMGDVPEHWEVKPVRHACQIDNTLRTPIDKRTRMDMAGEYPYYGPTGILSRINKFNVEGEYFLLGEDGDHFLKFNKQPMTLLASGQFNVNNHAHLIKGKGACSTIWARLYFEHKDLLPWLIKQGVGRYKLRKEILVTIPIVVPPDHEQRRIVEEINQTKLTFESLVVEGERAIELLQERRTALISAAVTGKIDVREVSLC